MVEEGGKPQHLGFFLKTKEKTKKKKVVTSRQHQMG
jgi:hypothetical protein